MFKHAFFSLAIFLFLVTPAFSQANSTPAPQETDLNTLISDYFFQLEQYRQNKDTFEFERAEFNKLGTLASQEDAVVALKALLTTRAKTQSSYLSILDNLLVNTQSIDIADKQTGLTALKESQAYISDHLSAIPAVADKNDVLAESLRFEQNSGPMFISLYRALSLIAISRVQNALDQTIVAANDFEQDIVNNIEDEDFRAANQRGLKEVALLLNDSIAAMDKAKLKFSAFDSTRKFNPQSTYKKVVKELKPTHTNLKQAVNFLIELEEGLN